MYTKEDLIGHTYCVPLKTMGDKMLQVLVQFRRTEDSGFKVDVRFRVVAETVAIFEDVEDAISFFTGQPSELNTVLTNLPSFMKSAE